MDDFLFCILIASLSGLGFTGAVWLYAGFGNVNHNPTPISEVDHENDSTLGTESGDSMSSGHDAPSSSGSVGDSNSSYSGSSYGSSSGSSYGGSSYGSSSSGGGSSSSDSGGD